jgi:hypothetical protein
MELADRLRPLADLLPILESPDADFGHWELPPPRDGVYTMGWFEFGPAAEAFRAAVGRGGWIVVFDWRTWLESDRGRTLRESPAAVADATVEELGHLLTAIIRSDRFVEGSIVGAFESGHLAAIARRAAVLLEGIDGSGRHEPIGEESADKRLNREPRR